MATHVVTGAFGYSGKYIAARLLENDHTVRTLTKSVGRENPFGGRVEAFPLSFDDPEQLVSTLDGADVLFNTYWVRFNHQQFTHSDAVANTLRLFEAARRAGVRRVVHVSITNPSLESDLEYFRGKAQLEEALKQSGLSYAILRPTVLFGKEDILINNIAWVLRRFPLFGVFGDGEYRVQPIYVDDLAALAVEQGVLAENVVIDAIGPETFSFRELVKTIGKIIGKQRRIVSVSPGFGFAVAKLIGRAVGDRFLTREEIEGLMRDLLFTKSPPTGEMSLTKWAIDNADRLGLRYANELARRRNRMDSYGSI
ncbi:MAG: NAD(P)H-binding protein [bacterium]|nr:NAD(P)H-binding protein [bacterium]